MDNSFSYENKSVLITGGTGTLGTAIAEYLLTNHEEIRELIIFSRDEQKQYRMAQEFPESKYPQIKYFIGDVRDRERLVEVFQGVDYVIHTAAMKHVRIAEQNPNECIKTNVGGAQNVVYASLKAEVERVVSLSTDKACSPVSLYGATKLTSDKIFIAANQNRSQTKFAVVRYGNIMGSKGSVVPFFKKCKETTGILPITDPNMTRFSISLLDGVKTVLFALTNTWGGEIFVPKLRSYKLIDLAVAICPNCEKNYIGIRQGEKLHEEMISASDSNNTYDLGSYFVILPPDPIWELNYFIEFFKAKKAAKNFSYNSQDHFERETFEDLKNLIL